MSVKNLTFELVSHYVSYDPLTGIFTWNFVDRSHFRSTSTWKTWNNKNAGKHAFSSKDMEGYHVGVIKGIQCYAHRIAWILMTGETPEIIDHIDRVRSNNIFTNLRNTDKLINGQNRSASKKNKTGFVGVQFYHGKYRAMYKSKSYGTYNTPEEAYAAYLTAKGV